MIRRFQRNHSHVSNLNKVHRITKDHLPRKVTPYISPSYLQLLYDLANLLVLIGVTFEDVRDPFVTICQNVTTFIGLRGDILCAPLIDDFGPHVS